MRKVIGIGETIFDIIFKNDQPASATPGGSSFNAIISLGRAGVPAAFVSETGDDHVGQLICSFAEKNGVDSSNIQIIEGTKSPVALAFLNERNDADYIFFKDHPNDKLQNQWPDIQPDDIVLFGSFYAINPVIRNRFTAFLEYARERGAILYYDVNFRKPHLKDLPVVKEHILNNIASSDIFRASDEDFALFLEEELPTDTIYAKLADRCPRMICTCGSKDAHLYTHQQHLTYAVKPIETVSTVGAGDNFNAGILYGLIKYKVRKADLDHLSTETWNDIIACAMTFSANVCQSVSNSIDLELAARLKSELQ